MMGGEQQLEKDMGTPSRPGGTEARPRPRPPHRGRHKRKLIDFKVNSFQKWDTSRPIPYMFDGRHSE